MGKTAINAPRVNTFLVDPSALTIVTDPKHPLYDERVDLPLDENMVKNIMTYGVKETILVRKDGDDILVVNGRQRTKHAIEANKRLLKAGSEIVQVKIGLEKGDDAEMVGIMISTNRFRQDDSPLVLAKKAQRLMAFGRTPEQAATTFGVTSTAIRQWLLLLELAPAVQKAVERGEVSASAASKLHGLKRDEQIAALDELKNAGVKVTAKTVKRAVAKKQGRVEHERPGIALMRRLYDNERAALNTGKATLAVSEVAILGWVLGAEKESPEITDALAALEDAEQRARDEKDEATGLAVG